VSATTTSQESTSTSTEQAGDEAVVERTGWWASHTSVTTRLAMAILAVSIAAIVVSVAVASIGAGSEAEDLIHTRLETLGGEKAAELESHLRVVEATVGALGLSPASIDAVQAFSDGYGDFATLTTEDVSDELDVLADFYLEDFIPTLEEVRGESVDILELTSGLEPAGISLQSTYIAENPFELGEKRLVTDGEDGSTWTEVHKEYHPTFRSSADRLGLNDAYLIDPDSLTVVYSVEKDIDFATSLDSGGFSGTTLAQLARDVVMANQPGAVFASDFSSYAPALDAPVAFFATGLFEGDELVGVLATQLSDDEIDDIMTRDWRLGLRGETGESYLVGPDRRMRSDSRAFLEDPDAYLTRVDELGAATSQEQAQMETLGTTVLFQEADSKAVRAALDGESGFLRNTSYLGEEVYTAYAPVGSGPFGWVMMVEQSTAEVDEPLLDYIRGTLIITAVFVLALTFLAVAWANSFVNPLRAITAALQRIRDGHLDTEVPSRGAREFRSLSAGLNAMVENLARQKRAVSDAVVQKVAVLRTLLPPAVAEAVDEGDRTLVETVPHSTVAVLVVEGINEIFQSRSVDDNRAFMHTVVDEADEIAAVNGLERIKVVGDTYYAVCGLGQPYIDQVARAARFVQQARDAILQHADDYGLDLDVAAGIHTGSITVGLTGDARLTYDLWGETVDLAYLLARAAERGQVLVTAEARERLPAEFEPLPLTIANRSVWLLDISGAVAGRET
jgi:class 3 adenylate cyclase